AAFSLRSMATGRPRSRASSPTSIPLAPVDPAGTGMQAASRQRPRGPTPPPSASLTAPAENRTRSDAMSARTALGTPLSMIVKLRDVMASSSAPGPHRLFEVSHPRRAAVHDDLAHLVHDGRRRRVDESRHQRELNHRPVALGDRHHPRHAGL